MIISRWILLRMKNVSDKICRENQNTYFVLSNFFFRKSCRLWDNVKTFGRARQTTDDNIIRRMRIACWINKATDRHSEYVIFIAFPRQQWLDKSVPESYDYTYISCLDTISRRSLACFDHGPFCVFVSLPTLRFRARQRSRNLRHILRFQRV